MSPLRLLPLSHWLDIPLIGLALGAGGAIGYWITVAAHVQLTRRLLPTARQGLDLGAAEAMKTAGPRVLIVIPAHNESRVIEANVRSLMALDYPNFHVVYALDRCTDQTRGILETAIGVDARFSIHDVRACPEGWAGKVNAVWSALVGREGAGNALREKGGRPELLLFADADTTFDPACLRATVALLRERGLDLLSLLSTLTTQQWFERLVQPVAAMELLRQAPPLRANRVAHGRPFANGQFMLFDAAAYDAIGGHEAVCRELLEDIHLARTVVRKGKRAGILIADGIVRCSMYRTYEAFVKGWKRIYIEVANRKPSRLRRAARGKIIADVLLPAVSVMAVIGGAIGLLLGSGPPAWVALGVGVLAILLMLLSLLSAFAMGQSWLPGVLAYPYGAWKVAAILREAAEDLETGRGVTWAGKTYERPVR